MNKKRNTKKILKLMCKRFKVQPGQCFRFESQETKDEYFFAEDGTLRVVHRDEDGDPLGMDKATVGYNWLLDDDCEVTALLNAFVEDKDNKMYTVELMQNEGDKDER